MIRTRVADRTLHEADPLNAFDIATLIASVVALTVWACFGFA